MSLNVAKSRDNVKDPKRDSGRRWCLKNINITLTCLAPNLTWSKAQHLSSPIVVLINYFEGLCLFILCLDRSSIGHRLLFMETLAGRWRISIYIILDWLKYYYHLKYFFSQIEQYTTKWFLFLVDTTVPFASMGWLAAN